MKHEIEKLTVEEPMKHEIEKLTVEEAGTLQYAKPADHVAGVNCVALIDKETGQEIFTAKRGTIDDCIGEAIACGAIFGGENTIMQPTTAPLKCLDQTTFNGRPVLIALGRAKL